MKLVLRFAFSAVVAICMFPLAHAGQMPVFVTGPQGDLRDATIPGVFGGPNNGNLSLVASTLAIDLSGTGRQDLLIGVGLNPLVPARKLALRALGSSANGVFSDVTRARFGNGNIPSAEAPRALYAADFNRDGRPDIFCACQGYDGSPPDGETNILLLSSPTGYVDRSDTLPTVKDYTHSAAIGDINGDGILDVFAGNIFGTFRVGPYFLLGKPDGTFSQVTSGLPASMSNLSEKYTYSYLLDVDNDTFPDLILGAEGDTTKRSIVLFNDGRGDFTKRPSYTLPTGPLGANNVVLHMATVDANADGFPDLLIVSTQFQPNYQGGSIQLLMNQRNGTFVDETVARLGNSATVTTGIGWNTVQVLDMNGDGKPDIVATSEFGRPGTSELSFMWINNGDGTFSPINVRTLSPAPIGKLIAIDADADGKLDLVSVTFFGDGSIHYQTYLNKTAPPAVRVTPSANLFGDGKSLKTWVNTSGAVTFWRYNGTAFVDTGVTIGPFPGWSLLSAEGDFDGDGKSDLLWLRTDGAISIWLMNGTAVKSQSQAGPYAGWSFFSGNSDFNGDGKTDLIWQRTDGAISLWTMNGGTLVEERTHGPFTGWSLLSGNNDFDGDGKSDLLWKKNTGAVSLWLMNGVNTKQVSPEYGPYPGWSVISGSSDYNGDGKTDLTWEKSDNAVSVWQMDGVTKTAESPQFGPYPGWRVIPGKRDFDSDSKSDLLWQRTDGAATIWLMNGVATPPNASTSVELLPGGAGWQLLSTRTDFNGDGKTDLVWQTPAGQVAVGLANGVVPPAPTLFGPYSSWSPFVGRTVP
jgi:hypothetical protein